ncbi:MAG: putative O-glycosylation ligase, exosortase A system-associated [Gammaproteobacteria bacterium]
MRGIVLALFIFGTIPFILTRPYIGLLVWSWIGYMNPHRLTYGFAYSFPWVMLIAVVTLVSLAVSKEHKKIPWSTVSVLLALFVLWTGFTTFYAVVPDAAWDKWQEFAKTIVMVFVTLMVVNTRERMNGLVWVIVVSLGFYGIKGGLFTILGGGGNHVFGPPQSFIGDNNALALALCMTLPLMRYLQLQAPAKSVKWGLGLVMFVTGVAVLGTYSRAGFIALAVVCASLLVKSRRRLTLLIAVVAVGMMAYQFMPTQWISRMETLHHADQTDSLQTRIQSWEFATNVALHRPLRGGGFDVYLSSAMWQRYGPQGAIPRAIHSVYFRVLGEHGFIGLLLFLGLLAATWRKCSQIRKRTRDIPDLKWGFDLASMMQVALLAFMAAGAAAPMSYFDLTYQLIALCALLHGLVARGVREPVTSHTIAPSASRKPLAGENFTGVSSKR